MHVDDDHRHYGSALIQIAEDVQFTAINAVRYRAQNSRCGFRINTEIGVYIRYRSEPKGSRIPIYSFAFSDDNLAELRRMSKRLTKVFVALVCVQDREICCLPYVDLEQLINVRQEEKGEVEDEYVIEAWIAPRKSFRVGISPPNTKGKWSKSFVIPRNDFPRAIVR